VRKVTSNRINEGVFAKQADGATRQIASGKWVLDGDTMRLCSVGPDGILSCERLEPGEYVISRQDTQVDADGNVLQFPPREEHVSCEQLDDGSVSCKLG